MLISNSLDDFRLSNGDFIQPDPLKQ